MPGDERGWRGMVVVPDYIHDGINALLDKALAEYPAAKPDRAYLYGVLLDHVDRTGHFPRLG